MCSWAACDYFILCNYLDVLKELILLRSFVTNWSLMSVLPNSMDRLTKHCLWNSMAQQNKKLTDSHRQSVLLLPMFWGKKLSELLNIVHQTFLRTPGKEDESSTENYLWTLLLTPLWLQRACGNHMFSLKFWPILTVAYAYNLGNDRAVWIPPSKCFCFS